MKKKYIKPTMKVYKLNDEPQLLAGSTYPNNWDGPIN